VNVAVDYHVTAFAARVASIVTGRSDSPFSELVVFGEQFFGRSGSLGNATTRGTGPTLAITFKSAGGSLYVRDYPDDIDPESAPDWPGYPVYPEPRPDVTGTPKAAAKRLLRNWRVRHAAQVRSRRAVEAARPGPCAQRKQARR
jgi:hypothetical protein